MCRPSQVVFGNLALLQGSGVALTDYIQFNCAPFTGMTLWSFVKQHPLSCFLCVGVLVASVVPCSDPPKWALLLRCAHYEYAILYGISFILLSGIEFSISPIKFGLLILMSGAVTYGMRVISKSPATGPSYAIVSPMILFTNKHHPRLRIKIFKLRFTDTLLLVAFCLQILAANLHWGLLDIVSSLLSNLLMTLVQKLFLGRQHPDNGDLLGE